MPHRFIPFIDSLFFTVASWSMFITFMSFVTAIPVVLSTVYWVVKIKREVDTKYGGNTWHYFKSLLKQTDNIKN